MVAKKAKKGHSKYHCKSCGSKNVKVQAENDVDWVHCNDCGNLDSHWIKTRKY